MKKTIFSAIFLFCINGYSYSLNNNQTDLILDKIFTQKFEVKKLDFEKLNKIEAEILIQKKSQRTAEKIKEIKEEAENPTYKYWNVLNIKMEDGSCLGNKILLEKILAKTSDKILEIKKEVNRTRPNKANELVNPVIPVPWHSSYPSGHATQAHLIYLIMKDWFPEKTNEFKKLSIQIGENREIAGLHYPSDSLEGKILAQKFYVELQKTLISEKLRKGCFVD